MSSAPDCVVCGLHPRAVCSACVSAGLQGKIAFGIDYPLESSMERCFYCRRQEAEWCWQCYSCASGDSYGLTHYTDHDLQNGQDGRYYVVLTSIALSKFQTQIGQVGSSIDPLVRKCRPPNHFNTSEGAAGSRAGRLSVYTPHRMPRSRCTSDSCPWFEKCSHRRGRTTRRPTLVPPLNPVVNAAYIEWHPTAWPPALLRHCSPSQA